MTPGPAGGFASTGISNHPGHDQKSHGRKGGGVRQSLADAKTTKQVEGVLRTELRVAMGRDVVVDLAGMDPGVAREHAEGILQGAERFPNSRLGRVDTYGPGGSRESHPGDTDGGSWAITAGGGYSQNNDVISFRVGGSPEEYRTMLSAAESAGWTTTGSPMGAALHEYGHLLTHDSVPARADDAAASAARTAGQSKGAHVRAHVSTYATQTLGELSAEAFADVMVNGTRASNLSQAIFSEIEADYARNGSRR